MKIDIEILKENFKGMSYEDSSLYQLDYWVNGISLHNPITDECCPDFSCCNGGKIMPIEMRQMFITAYKNNDKATYGNILGIGLREYL